ncbi:uncharacterized protein LOC122724910 [Manihot esculenta]|uniref:uncharacterized protein LOC122724910 n=1 Tax=Manihot esculenta TaxID=3983 RepID=UPI001CC77D63|nr:uncharacterized protein LOC122724910 [Manihot esculenta]
MDAMSLDLNSVKQARSTSPEAESQARPRHDKGTVGTSSSVTTRDCSFVPKYTKLDFPRYNGTEDPLGWISRCQHFFKHQSTPDDEQVGLASYHLEGIVQLWYLQLIQDVPNPTWVEFVDQCNLRFGPPIRSNKLGELAKLKQTGTVEDYQTKFEILVSRAGTLGSNQKVQLYISGLQEYIAVEVELHQPKDLATAMSMSRLYERKLYSKSVAQREVRRPAPLSEHCPGRTIKRLTPDEMDERRKKGLCFNCDEPFVRGHQCKRLFLIDLDDGSKSDAKSDSDSPPEISLHAITGTRNSQSMRLLGCWHGRQVLILVDSGSTHSFVSDSVVADLQVTVDAKDGLRVKVANGEQLHSPGLCKGAPIELGNSVFIVDLFVLQLTGFDLVFGVNWLATLGPILWDFNSMWMSFFVNGKQVALTGIDSKSETNSSLNSLSPSAARDHHLRQLLADFAAILEAPTGLPPARHCDHRIPLAPNTKPVVVHPYRYPHNQKDEIERQCTAMLDQGIIRPSRSPFSSPVLLVPKADKTWHLCVDYRELNARTIKDKFPIPVIEELLDELGGTKYFTKLDLVSGYFQVGMHPPDIEKTAFRTHHGHFEFLVMPFGLSNAPSTFQALMNEPLGRKQIVLETVQVYLCPNGSFLFGSCHFT